MASAGCASKNSLGKFLFGAPNFSKIPEDSFLAETMRSS